MGGACACMRYSTKYIILAFWSTVSLAEEIDGQKTLFVVLIELETVMDVVIQIYFRSRPL